MCKIYMRKPTKVMKEIKDLSKWKHFTFMDRKTLLKPQFFPN